MKTIGACVLTLLLVAGCGNTNSLTLNDTPTSYTLDASNYWYAASVNESPCRMMMTVSGALKQKCAQ